MVIDINDSDAVVGTTAVSLDGVNYEISLPSLTPPR
jgi:hypothetical protein